MHLKRLILLFPGLITIVTLHAKDIDVTTYGVKGDSISLNSANIQKAIDETVQRSRKQK